MKKFLPLSLLLFVTGFICHYDPNAKNETFRRDTVSAPNLPAGKIPDSSAQAAANANLPKPNVSQVFGTVKSISQTDSLLFQVSAQIDSASSVGGMASFAEAGAVITLTPHYILDANGSVDFSNERNQRLLSLRSLKPGEHFQGKIVRQPLGNWTIIDTL